MKFGKVFCEGHKKGILCEVEVFGKKLVAEERNPEGEPRRFEFLLASSELTFGGTDDCKVVLTSDGATVYLERNDFEADLERLGCLTTSQALDRARFEVRGKRFRSGLLTTTVLVLLVVGGLGLNALLDLAIARMVAAVPVTWEEQLGEVAFAGQDWEEVTDPEIAGAVEKIVDRLKRGVGETPYTFEVKVVRDEMVNAFAAPGGKIVVFTGLLEKAESPEEVAGVLAHELQHVLSRHSLRGLAGRLKWHLVIALLVGDVGTVQEAVLANAPLFLELSFSRDMEREADRKGIELLVASEIDPVGLKRFFERLLELQGGGPGFLKILSTHPATDERIEDLQRLVAENDGRAYRPLEIDWEGVQQSLKRGK